MFYTVTDLSSSSIVRKGRTALFTIPANGIALNVTDAISPPLPNADLANWRILALCEADINGNSLPCLATLRGWELTTVLISFDARAFLDITQTSVTGLTTSPEPDTGHFHTTPSSSIVNNASFTGRIHWTVLKA